MRQRRSVMRSRSRTGFTEITQLALINYRTPDTGEHLPLLQIVPSKSNQERVLLVSPELASVLATIIARHRADNGEVSLGPAGLTATNAQRVRPFRTFSNAAAPTGTA